MPWTIMPSISGGLHSTSALDYLTNPELLLDTLLAQFGPWMVLAVAVIIFIESGVLFPVLPGDALIFTLGIVHNRLEQVPLPVTFVVLFLAAIAGNLVGYWLGARFGRRLFRENAKFLNYENLGKAEDFFARYGGRSLVLARFVPFVRTFVPIVAGIARFKFSTFLVWNVVGAAAWIGIFLIAGTMLGEIEFVAKNIEVMAIAVVLVSLLPMLFEYLKHRRAAKTND